MLPWGTCDSKVPKEPSKFSKTKASQETSDSKILPCKNNLLLFGGSTVTHLN